MLYSIEINYNEKYASDCSICNAHIFSIDLVRKISDFMDNMENDHDLDFNPLHILSSQSQLT